MKSIALTGLAVLLTAGGGTHLAAAGVGGPAFFVDGNVYRTTLTPTDLPQKRGSFL